MAAFVFLAHPDANNLSYSPVQNIADRLSPGVVIKSVKEMVARVLFHLAQSGGKISSMAFAGHGGQGFFYIGVEKISHLTIMDHKHDLTKLAPHFAPGATITLYSCETAYNPEGMYLLSYLWPGVSVKGFTWGVQGYVDPLFGNGIETNGQTIICTMLGCYGKTKLQSNAGQLVQPSLSRFL